MIKAEAGACCGDCEECQNCEAPDVTVHDLLEGFGLDLDRTPVDVLMRQPAGVGLAVGHMMEHGDDKYEE